MHDVEGLWNMGMNAMRSPNIALDALIPICKYDAKFIEFATSYPKALHYVVVNDLVYITHNASSVHQFAQSSISDSVTASINSQMPIASYSSSGWSCLVYNRYTCHSIQEKYCDFGIYDRNESLANPEERIHILKGEIAFTHEAPYLLVCECAHYLSEFTTGTAYSIGVHIAPTREFSILFFLFERTSEPDVSAIDKIRGLYYRSKIYQYKTPADENSECSKHPDLPLEKTRLDSFFTDENIRKSFQVKLRRYLFLNEHDVVSGATIEFQLDGTHFGVSGNVRVEIPNIVLRDLLLLWHNAQENNFQ